jgi:hypothetical protein
LVKKETIEAGEGSSNEQRFNQIFYALAVLMVATVLLLFRDFGVTWDEPNQNQYGKYILQYYESFFRDRNALNFLDAYLYGGLFDSVAALLMRMSPLGEYETRHLLNGLAGVVGIVGVWKLTGLLAGQRAALVAGLLLFLEPNYFGQMFNNHKDVPFAAGYVWSLAYLLESLAHFPRIPNRLIFKFGLAIGLTLGVRIGGFMLLSYLGLAGLVYLVLPAWFSNNKMEIPHPGERVKKTAGSLAAVGAIAYAVMLVFWPWAQQNPLLRPFQALAAMSRFGLTDSGLVARVLLAGEYAHAKDLPTSYLPHYFWVKMPELVLAGVGCGVVMGIWHIAKGILEKNRLLSIRYAFLAFAILAPVIYAIATKAVLYDAIRHFTFLIPLLCAVSGTAIERLCRVLGGNLHWRQWAVALLLMLVLLPQALAVVRLHPHQYVFYNSLVGGVKGAQGQYELDYWGNSYKEAVELLTAYLEDRADERNLGRVYRIAIWGPATSAAYYFPSNFQVAQRIEEADFLISFTRWGFHEVAPGRRIATVERMGATLSVVHDLRAGKRHR